MKFIIILLNIAAVVFVASANMLQYPVYHNEGYNNMPGGYNYPAYTKPLQYQHHHNHHQSNNYVVKPQYPSINGPVCATYNGMWKTFANIYQFKDEINQGHGKFFSLSELF